MLRSSLLGAASATVLLCALAATASAGRLSFSSQTLRATFREVRFSGGFGTTVCAVTLEGSLHARVIPKVIDGLIGYVTRASLGSCIQGSATILREFFPWHVTFQEFGGTLPAINVISTYIIEATFQIREPVFGITCLARSSVVQPVQGIFGRGAEGTLASVGLGGSVPTNCGSSGGISGTSNSLTVLNSSTRVTVTLI